MTIRGDLEALLWKELDKVRAREVVAFWFDSLVEADFIRHAVSKGFTDAEIVAFCHILGSMKEATLTHISTDEN